ncbi:hypothetical protein HaLaN_32312 [Haematococcus lacustris]|uniref:Uncharacterized protein n=1 Tax=Haematococcus lacustris TaxID=44745 RepID=A0A6A0AL34_HAELA|nr:hypothetical protein HaLaN_32312 [Haematococcus lacustris]
MAHEAQSYSWPGDWDMSAALDIRSRRGMEKLPRIRCDLRHSYKLVPASVPALYRPCPIGLKF